MPYGPVIDDTSGGTPGRPRPPGYRSSYANDRASYSTEAYHSGVPVRNSAVNSYIQMMNNLRSQGYAPQPMGYGGGGGGGGYGGGGYGGGGGGGGPAMTQSMFDQMVALLGQQSPQLNLPGFQGANVPAFNAAPYTQALQQLQQAVAADRSNVMANTAATEQALQQGYTNSYANLPVQGAVAPPATAGGTPEAQAVAAEGASDQAAFQNVIALLGAASNQAQQSRVGQVAMDRNTALQNIGAQQLGMQGGINMARTQAQNQWAQQDAERRYQNSLLAQQWAREQAMANWEQQNAVRQNNLSPLLDLLARSSGLNTDALQQLIATWGR